MKYLLYLLLLVWALPAQADLLQLQAVDLQYQHFEGVARDPLYPASSIDEAFKLGLKIDLAGVVGLDADIVAGTDQTQFHVGGLEYFTYVRITQSVQVGWSHESLHIFDSSMPGGYPLENTVEVRVNIFDRNQARKSIF